MMFTNKSVDTTNHKTIESIILEGFQYHTCQFFMNQLFNNYARSFMWFRITCYQLIHILFVVLKSLMSNDSNDSIFQ